MSTLWLITTYFNPLNWCSRRRNYHSFRRHLGANLLTVEWSPSGDFSLREEDADRLVRVSGGDLMWQKERLINIGLAQLPDDCDLVGWVDCDILFRDPHWSHRAVELLANHDVVQLYGEVEYLDHDTSLAAEPCSPAPSSSHRRPSLIHAWRSAEDPDAFLAQDLRIREQLSGEGSYRPPSSDTSPGFAWAARRSWLDMVGGLADRMIVGSGDLHCAYGFLGRLGDYAEILERCGLGGYFSSDSLQWSIRVQESAPRVNSLSGLIAHLHHGDLVDRGYLSRQYALVRSGFLPDHHLELDPGGSWRFNAAAPPAIQELMASYFTSRREDGDPVTHG